MKKRVNILSTRPLEDALLSTFGLEDFFIDCIPFIETEPIESPDIADVVAMWSLKHIVVVFTSANAVKAVIPYMEEIPKWKIFCINGSTKNAVADFFGEKSIVASAKNATLLANEIIADKEISEVTFFCGNQRLPTLPEALIAHKIECNEVVVYETFTIDHVVTKDYDAILFFSPSAVHSFFENNTIHTDVVLFSIGERTTATIKTYCANEIQTCNWPSQEAMIQLVNSYKWD